ncbi:MAG TPA: sugar kinase [Planctomycetaceae bacterium]|nr:sugar kinase [Planctomycetaceae bacterium]
MSLLVVGSVALDSIETPSAARENILGGSAVFGSFAASFFAPVQLVGVVGEDWPVEHTRLLERRGIDMSGLEVSKGGKTFRWSGKYMRNMNDRETLETQLNVLGDFQPKLPETFRRAQFVLLGNGSTVTQHMVIDQLAGADLVVADTMNLWINIERESLDRLLKRIDGLVLNDEEAKMLTDELNVVTAGRRILDMGPKFVVIKKGEHGAMFLSGYDAFLFPAYPTEGVVDPTGAGDCFAGGMMGYLASVGRIEPETIKTAIAYGTLVASFCVEGFSLDRLSAITKADLDRRLGELRQMASF